MPVNIGSSRVFSTRSAPTSGLTNECAGLSLARRVSVWSGTGESREEGGVGTGALTVDGPLDEPALDDGCIKAAKCCVPDGPASARAVFQGSGADDCACAFGVLPAVPSALATVCGA